MLSGLSLDGKKFFYVNPLASAGNIHREEWFGCACCPPNIARLLTSLGGYIYSQNDDAVAIHLYAASSTQLQVGGHAIMLRQQTRYPWDGAVHIEVELEQAATFTLKMRIPNWCDAPALYINGEPLELSGILDRGYTKIERVWQSGDQIELQLPMEVRRVYAHPAVLADEGCVTLQRGPMIYCLEATDNTVPLHLLALSRTASLQDRYEPDLLGGVVTLHGLALYNEESGWESTLYRAEPPQQSETQFTATPYFAWDNRQPGAMRVWIREAR
jgi:DUF1680 family protein